MSSVLIGRYRPGAKPCKRCGTGIYSDTGRISVCAPCKRAGARERMRKWIDANPNLHRARSSASHTPREPHKERAKAAVYRAIQRGDLTRGECEVCGEAKVDAHHDDYCKPLSVRWMCRRHHAEIHRKDSQHVVSQ